MIVSETLKPSTKPEDWTAFLNVPSRVCKCSSCALGESRLKLCTQLAPCFLIIRSVEACVTKPKACKRVDFIAFVTLGALSFIVC